MEIAEIDRSAHPSLRGRVSAFRSGIGERAKARWTIYDRCCPLRLTAVSKKREKTVRRARKKRRLKRGRRRGDNPRRGGRSPDARDLSTQAARHAPATSPLLRTAAELTADLGTLASELVASMAPHDAFDIVATLSFLHFVQDPDEYREAEQTPAAHIEYAVDLARKRGNRRGTNDRRDPIDGATLEGWNQKLGMAVALSLLVASKS